MPTATYDLISSQTLGSTTATVTFSSITSSYRDLVIVISGPSSYTNTTPKEFRLNSDSGSNYSSLFAFATGSGVGTDKYGNMSRAYMSRNASLNSGGTFILQLLDYSTTNKHKPFLVRASQAGAITEMTAGRWASTSAITSIEFGNSGADSWGAGTTFTLYGIVS